MQKYNICIPVKYKTKYGDDKTKWNNIGELIEWEPGKFSLDLYHMPNVKIMAFPIKPKEDKVENKEEVATGEVVETGENIDMKDIPF